MASNQDMSMAVNIPANAPQHVYAAAAEQALAWGRADGALDVCELGLKRHPAYTGLRLFRAEALLTHDRRDEAESDLLAVLSAEPQHPRALKVISSVLMDQRRYREALPFLERAEFLLFGDPEISAWLADAESREDEETEVQAAPPDALYSPEVQQRVGELLALQGVHSVVLDGGSGARVLGVETGNVVKGLAAMAALEESLGEVLAEAGLGTLTDVSLQTADTQWTSRRGPRGVVRVAAAVSLREGLLAWHTAKVLSEAAS